ncbi:DNA-binding HxlR family transcriptional regulator [Amycolatopsis bartoniae]|uniref:HxlR family transcriptional regulator n=1 Tax=Amycolatopsis bartoniae TaxID=941986 RepID=A0A8H9MBZ4_9PSEU|nr:helix-turn-helix domain-containing protein [Amycolatopsis bartoniae]MBB2939571.1 DNA-binding HxlR family transcriptional regulator [Amycolatopsis bartoniae]TVT07783.1 helix-turn-helix transcriptional regulator [Amycolatopsis bartoniae]GHF39291.1 HxlR family transcriptional regulator [Amycolatopsis bartoniae]
MTPRLDEDSPACSIERSLTVLGERWTPLILRELFFGFVRFADIQQRLGIATNLLTTRLATLVDAGVVEKRPYREAGARTRYEYHLTGAGRDALVVLGALQQWGDRHLPRASGPSLRRRDRRTGAPLDVTFTGPDGRAVPLDEVEFTSPAGR